MSTQTMENTSTTQPTIESQSHQISRWPTKEEKHDTRPSTYTKEQLLALFRPNMAVPEGFNAFPGITSEKCLEPINYTNLFQISNDVKINPENLLLTGGRGRGRGRGLSRRGGLGRGRGGRIGVSTKEKTPSPTKTGILSPDIIEEGRVAWKRQQGIKDVKEQKPEQKPEIKHEIKKPKISPDIDMDSLWEYRDKDGTVHPGPFTLRKLDQWVGTFHPPELEIRQVGTEDFVMFKDVIKIAEENEKLKMQKEEHIEPKEDDHIVKSVLDVMGESQIDETKPIPKPMENIFQNQVIPQSHPPVSKPFFPTHPQHPPHPQHPQHAFWSKPPSLQPVPEVPKEAISATDIEKQLKQVLNLGQLDQTHTSYPSPMLTEEDLLRQGVIKPLAPIEEPTEPKKEGKTVKVVQPVKEQPKKKKKKSKKKKETSEMERKAKEEAEKLEKERKEKEERERKEHEKQLQQQRIEEAMRAMREREEKEKQRQSEFNITQFLPPQLAPPEPKPLPKVWNTTDQSQVLSFSEIQKLESKQLEMQRREGKKKRELEEKMKKEKSIAWPSAMNFHQAPSFHELQLQEELKNEQAKKQQKAQKQKVVQQTQNVGNIWGVTPTTVPTFAEIQQQQAKEQSKVKQSLVPKQVLNPWPVQQQTMAAKLAKTTKAKVETKTETKTEKKKKKKKVKDVIAQTQSQSIVEEQKEEEPELFWDYPEKQSRAFTTIQSEKKEEHKEDKKKKKKKKKKSDKSQSGTYAHALSGNTSDKRNAQQNEEFPELPQPKPEEEGGNPFGGAEASEQLRSWYKSQMAVLGRKCDYTLMNFLLSCESDQEIRDYITEYVGASPTARKFADEFIRYKNFEKSAQQPKKKKKKSKK